jgi:hypothetical protein
MMMKSLAASAALGLLFAGSAYAANEGGTGQPEIISHRPNPGDAGMGYATAGGTGALSAITYHGGPVMGTPNVYVIWYGNWNQGNGSDTSGGQALVNAFLGGESNSAYFKINTTYSASGGAPTGAISVKSSTTDAYSQGTRLSDSKVLAVVSNAITSGKLPKDTNGVYFVLTSSDVSENSGFCNRYCGWHTHGTVSGADIKYSFVGNANRCLSSCAAQTSSPNGNAGVDGMISVIAHELEEATTDPDLNAWYDGSGAENADKCAWTFGQLKSSLPGQVCSGGTCYNQNWGGHNWLIQRNLQANTNKCYLGLNGAQ